MRTYKGGDCHGEKRQGKFSVKRMNRLRRRKEMKEGEKERREGGRVEEKRK